MKIANLLRWFPRVLILLPILLNSPATNAEDFNRTPTGRASSARSLSASKSNIESNAAVRAALTNSVTGKWTDTYSFQWSVSEAQSGNISGLAQVNCTAPWVITGSASGTSFKLHASNPVSDQCTQWFEYSMGFTSPTAAVGTWTNSAGGSGTVTMSSTENCASVINNALSGPNLSGGGLLSGSTNISATFTPSLNGTPYSLQKAAQLCGFVNFDWIQTITTLPNPSPFFARSNGLRLTSASTPFNDPPAGGGYTYEGTADNSYPFYYDARNGELISHEDGNTLSFGDAPSDPCLPGPLGLPSKVWLLDSNIRSICQNTTAPIGSSIGFTTHLAGVMADGSAVDLGVGFTWKSNFNGTFGSIAQTKADASTPPDAGSGEGGITITSINPTTTYTYLGFAISPPVLLTGSQVSITVSGFVFNRSTHTFDAMVTVKNISNKSISGPLQVVFSSLPSGVDLMNAANGFGGYNMFGGFPYATIQNASSLATGQSTTIIAKFLDPSSAQISFTPLIYAGSFAY